MTIAIFAPRGADIADDIARRVAARTDAPAHRFSVDPTAAEPAAVDGAAVSWGGVRLDRASAVFITGFRYEDPVLPPVAGVEADWSLWQARHVLRQQGYSFCWSFFSRLEAAGVKLYNPPSVLLNLFCRQRPLDMLRAAGLPAVATTVTNDPAAAEAVQGRGGVTVWRPATGRAAWQVFRDKQRRHLVAADKPPVMLVTAAPGPVLRVYVVNGAVALVLIAAPPAHEGVERFEVFKSLDPASVPGVAVVSAAAEKLGLNWGVFTVVAGENGVTIFDVDPDPVIADLPVALREHLTEALACGLSGAPLPPPPTDTAEQRETLLLRRMLTIQFEMEATKHAPA
jgi:hypothetical protein